AGTLRGKTESCVFNKSRIQNGKPRSFFQPCVRVSCSGGKVFTLGCTNNTAHNRRCTRPIKKPWPYCCYCRQWV
ncbi:hypothetical protein MTO96_043446, partial [Rhipicephalus appendiculatus]